MVLKQVTVCIILLYLLCARVEAQTIDNDLQKINQELDKLILKYDLGSPSTEDEKELKKEVGNLQTARDLDDSGNDEEKRNSLSAKSEAIKAFEYYLSRREDLKATISRLLSLAENLNDSLTANNLKSALNHGNGYKEFAIMNALERLTAVQINPTIPNDPNLNPNPNPNLNPNRPNDLSSLLDILSKFIGPGGQLFSPNVYNQITWDPSKNNDLNDQLRDLISKLNKKLDSFKNQDNEDWSEWFEWFDE